MPSGSTLPSLPGAVKQQLCSYNAQPIMQQLQLSLTSNDCLLLSLLHDWRHLDLACAPFCTCNCGRQRYLDLIVSDDTRATFRARSKIISALRRHLEDQGFLEVGAGEAQGLHRNCINSILHAEQMICMLCCDCLGTCPGS